MAYVTSTAQSIKSCFQNHYSLPYFQRDYKWEIRQFSEMINDIQATFLGYFEASHGRKEVASYLPYFIGSIITAAESNGKKPLIDGQQRLTSIFLLLAYLERYRNEYNIENALDMSSLLGSTSFGTVDYSLEFSDSRKKIFDMFLNDDVPFNTIMEDIEEICDLDEGDKRLLEALRGTDSLLDDDVKNNIAYFIDYVVEKILVIDISVDSESEAHRVFVTMNDRGLRLGPIDLLKGQILSKVIEPAANHECHRIWVENINKLRGVGSEEDSLFFRSLFRGRWAETIREKSKGAAPGDFDVIGDAYHRWFEGNLGKIGLTNSDEFVNFVRDDIPTYTKLYIAIQNAEENISEGLECLYYNAARKFSFQPMILFAVTQKDDSTTSTNKKIALVSKFIDIILTSRMIDGKQNNYDNLRDISFSLTQSLRNKSFENLQEFIRGEWPKYYSSLVNISQLNYEKDKSSLLYILSRISCYLEDAFVLTNRVGFTTYWQRNRATKTFDIEHILKKTYDPTSLHNGHGFLSEREYTEQRNLIGGLTLLPRSRNRSLQDKTYRDKLPAYATENILTQTLCEALYTNNPNVAAYVAENSDIPLASVSDFGKSEISKRAELYVKIAQKIWATP